MNRPLGKTPDAVGTAEPSLADFCRERLAAGRDRVRNEPKHNAVSQLAFELSRQLEGGRITRKDLFALAADVCRTSLEARAARLAAHVGPVDMDENRARLKAAILALLGDETVTPEALARIARRALGIVFTAHPTFLLSTPLRKALAALASGKDPGPWSAPLGPDRRITLVDEHEAAMAALDSAKAAVAEFNAIAIEILKEKGYADWRHARIGYVGLGTWVGYDLDGRTDIRWVDSFRFRLVEKIRQIGRYEAELTRIAGLAAGEPAVADDLEALASRLSWTRAATERALAGFSVDALDPKSVTAAANALTGDYPNKAVRIAPFVKDLQRIADRASDGTAVKLLALASEMEALSFGVGEVHLRINATQLHNALRHHLHLDSDDHFNGRSMIERLSALMREAKPLAINFGSIDIETKTAMRQFLLAAQILKHVDADSTVRFLIAECETPATVLCAFYFARLFGIAEKLDVSPLFETPKALESAARFFDVMFETPEYREQVRRRGRLAIQTGFSDAGRFMGQITAVLAIERVHGHLARAVERHGLTDVEVLVFDTHGESAGRGAHPTSFEDRAYYVMSPWARRQFAERGIHLVHEVSFQGGDGYVHFETPELSLATVTRLIEADAGWAAKAEDDLLYERTNFTYDFFRRLAAYHGTLLDDRSYHRALGSFAQGLLNDTGSRKSRRQFDVSGGEVHQIRRIRAIPHNAMLQQLGYPVNVVAGFGSATKGEEDRFVEIYAASDRLRRLTGLVLHSKRLASIKTLNAFANLYDPAFWSSRPYPEAEQHLTEPCLYIAQLLQNDDREVAINALAVSMRLDAIYLHRLFGMVGLDVDDEAAEERERIALLQAVRLALLQHIFLMAARVPRFSTRNDVSREDIMELVFSLRIPEAIAMLRDTYPVNATDIGSYALDEPRTYPEDRVSHYADITEEKINPMEETYGVILSIGAAIALEFGAHG
ncbi:phosphoenolpyruvate carboxylase [Prosthecomicrobium sp. N25]|uniref:phosphoenolpyruvate carboxylase n=1 Tax=Prosthecomicrobium sp. N25 TaxID=3129254 RepID=UPI003076CD9F